MNLEITKAFDKDAESIRHPKLERQLREAVLGLRSATSLVGLPNVSAMTGYKNAYRVRVGDYRLGCRMEGNTLVLARFLHRKEIYRYFP